MGGRAETTPLVPEASWQKHGIPVQLVKMNIWASG